MAKYTMTIQHMIEVEKFQPITRRYPVFEETYRPKLNSKIIEHYWFREIGFETKEIFRDRIGVKLNEIMPYFNQLYLSELIKINPLYNVDMTEVSNRDNSGVGVSQNSAKANSSSAANDDLVHAYSATPQGVNTKEDIQQFNYVTNTDYDLNERKSTDESTSAQSSDTRFLSEEVFWRKLEGNNGKSYPAEQLLAFRKTFLNIDMMVIDELQPLFMGIY